MQSSQPATKINTVTDIQLVGPASRVFQGKKELQFSQGWKVGKIEVHVDFKNNKSDVFNWLGKQEMLPMAPHSVLE